jgi:SIR2-like domain/TIR domain
MGNSDRSAERGGVLDTNDASPPKIFINYRHSDAGGWARLLCDRLAARFGADNVFLDVVSQEPGTRWLETLRSRGSGAAAFIALIGPKWVSIMNERAGSPEEDQVRTEIERALRPDSRVELIVPVLIDDAVLPEKEGLPRPLWPLLGEQDVELRSSRLDADVQELIEILQPIMGTTERPAERSAPEARDASPPDIFLNYRHSDAGGWARLLYDRLAARFGAENVFLDVVSQEPGLKRLESLRSRGSGTAAFIALIGPAWASIMNERAGSTEEDHVRTEIEQAFRRDSHVGLVVPALIDDAVLPAERDLPRPLWPLLHRQDVELRPSRFDADVQKLIEILKSFGQRPTPQPADLQPSQSRQDPHQDQIAPPPDRGHYEELVRLMVEDGSVVPFLGPGANSSDRDEPWQEHSGYIPDADELAVYLANKLDSSSTPADLTQASQYLSVANGPSDLYKMLRRALPPRCSPSSVHQFLAELPARMHRLGLPERHQLIVTTNYDDALERAFDEAEEAYELAVYIASGPDKGGFVHVPYDGEPQPVTTANEYRGFPINEYGEVTRTVIMKIHGAADAARGVYPWHDNYVITEDDYIEYLSDRPISKTVPWELLGKLKESHFLFLGYTMRDWNLRVFLKRIFGEQLQNISWAIQQKPDKLESRFWKRMGIDLFAISLESYLDELGSHVAEAATASGA